MMDSNERQQPLVSVIMPAYNADRFITAALESILSQTYRNIEVIVVDDGSTDRTGELVLEIAAHDRRVILHRQHNSGVAAARNAAIQMAKGEFIAPIDADDIWLPEKLERQVAKMQESSPAVGLVYAWSLRLDADGRVIGRGGAVNLRGNVYAAFVYKNFCSASAPLIKKTCLDRAGGYDPTLRERDAQGCEDIDLLLRIAELYEFELVPEYLVGYRQSAGSMSRNVAAMERSFRLVMAEAQRRHPELPKKIFSWAHGQFYLHLAGKCMNSGDHHEVLGYLCKAVRWDAELLLLRRTYRRGLSSLMALCAERLGASMPVAGENRERDARQMAVDTGGGTSPVDPEYGSGAEAEGARLFGGWWRKRVERRLAFVMEWSRRNPLLIREASG